MSIGTSIELLARSALALINPALISDRDTKSALLFSGVPVIAPEKGRTRAVVDCVGILQQSHSIDYNHQSDGIVFEVRNLAVHMGFADSAQLEASLNVMVTVSEQILSIVSQYDASLTRDLYWSPELLVQVDERLKEQRQALLLELEQLKAAARREIERLRSRGIDDDVLTEMADRHPDTYDDTGADDVLDESHTRRPCPVCSFKGWLDYSVERSPIEYDWGETDYEGLPTDERPGPVMWVELSAHAIGFYCHVCSLRLPSNLLSLVGMDDLVELDRDDPTQGEIDAAEQYTIGSYHDDLRKD
jgi:hypothetical protein